MELWYSRKIFLSNHLRSTCIHQMADSGQTSVFACLSVTTTKSHGIRKLLISTLVVNSVNILRSNCVNSICRAWSVSTILTGLLSIMLENSPLLGSCESTLYEKKKLAMNSLDFNLKNEVFRWIFLENLFTFNFKLFFLFRELFPDLVTEITAKLEKINEIKKRNEKEASEKALTEPKLDSATNGTAYNLCTNVIILVMFGIFVCIVKKIYESGEQEE